MDVWFSVLCAQMQYLPPAAVHTLYNDGFAIIPGPLPQEKLADVAAAYDRAIAEADGTDIAEGSSTTRINDFVNRGPIFDGVYVYPPLLEACCRVIRQPFKLSTMHARTLKARSAAQKLHIDFPSDEQGWPMVGFILMIDEFRPDNGATCFIPRSQGADSQPFTRQITPACGPAGMLIIYNGSVWHGHGVNSTGQPRRSIQGAYIRRTEKSGGNLPARMRHVTLQRIGPLANYLLEL